LEAQRFIGKCLVTASKRLSAKELLLDPFLACDEDEQLPMTKLGSQKPFLNKREMEKPQSSHDPNRTNMTITGKLNPDDSIFLKVQIANKDGTSFALEMQCSHLIVSMESLFWNTSKHILS
jgi:WNK lysine deficient protein kinase